MNDPLLLLPLRVSLFSFIENYKRLKVFLKLNTISPPTKFLNTVFFLVNMQILVLFKSLN